MFSYHSYITQATIDSLEKCTEGNPRAPLRLAFGNNYQPIRRARKAMAKGEYKFVQEALEHFCKMRQFAAPEFLRKLVAGGVQANMPRGIIVHRVTLRAGTLQALATGSDMVKLSLPDLAASILGDRVSPGVREKVREIFGRAEAASCDVILKELDEEHEKAPLLTMQDNVAKQAILRLKDHMAALFGGKMPDCPVLLAPIPRERVRILKCCTAIIDCEALAQLQKKECPLCRASIGTGSVAEVKPEAKPEAKSEGKMKTLHQYTTAGDAPPTKRAKVGAPGSPSLAAKPEPEAETELEAGGPRNEGCEDHEEAPGPPPEEEEEAAVAFEQALEQIAAAGAYSIDGVLQIMRAQVRLCPTSRMLLCFGFVANQRSMVRKITDRILAEIPGAHVSDIDHLAKDYVKMDEAKHKFDAVAMYPAPQVFIINTTESSSSVQGLDLHRTNLTIVADHCALHTQRQAVGRSLRMQVLPKGAAANYRFPAKRVVVASIGAIGPAQ